MGAKTETVGGGPATGLADSFTKYLQTQIGQQQTAMDNFGRADPYGSTQNFAGTANQRLSNPFVDTSALKAQGGSVQPPAPANLQNPDIGSFVQQLMGQQAGHTTVSAGTPTGLDFNSPHAQALMSILNQQNNANVADLRSRFGAAGGAAFGTPAAYAEAQYRSQAAPALANALGNLDLQYQNQDLANRNLGVDAQVYGGQLNNAATSINQQGLLGAIQSLLTGANNQNQNILAARGQDINSQVANRGMNIDALSRALGLDLSGQQMGQQQSQFNATQQNNSNNLMLQILSGISQLGIPQAQTIQKPGFLQNLLSAGAGVAGAVSGFGALGNPFGGGGIVPAPQMIPFNPSSLQGV